MLLWCTDVFASTYTWQEKRPALSWTAQEREILNQINPQRKLLLA
jgi:hypothetical protein